MRREAFFSADAPYDVLVRSNALLHREAAERLRACLEGMAPGPGHEVFEVLDLACGRTPVIVADAMEAMAPLPFRYVGVDINPDQVGKARDFPFPDNVVEARILEGSAWSIGHIESPARFDLVFIGMNWHHGTPEEIWYLAKQLRGRLAPAGRLVNHDCYRPDREAYLRRPESAVGAGGIVDLTVVDARELGAAAPPDFALSEQAGDARPKWKCDLIDRLERAYREHGGSDAGAEIVTAHSWERDFPVSAQEVRAILRAAGFESAVERYRSEDGPLTPYVALVTAWSS